MERKGWMQICTETPEVEHRANSQNIAEDKNTCEANELGLRPC